MSAINGNFRIVEMASELGLPVVLSPLLSPGWNRATARRAELAERLAGRLTDWMVQTSYAQTKRALQLASAIGDARNTVQEEQTGRSPGGKGYTRTVYYRTADGAGPSAPPPGKTAVAEHWVLHGAGHAWAGGHAGGSHTDPGGVNATQEMLRFFLAHPRAAGPT